MAVTDKPAFIAWLQRREQQATKWQPEPGKEGMCIICDALVGDGDPEGRECMDCLMVAYGEHRALSHIGKAADLIARVVATRDPAFIGEVLDLICLEVRVIGERLVFESCDCDDHAGDGAEQLVGRRHE